MFCRSLSRAQSRRDLASHLGVMLFIMVLCLQVNCVLGQQAVDQAPEAQAATATPEQVEQWIAELDDNQFAKREHAQSQLEDAGLAALPQVAEEAQTGSLESSTRALNILLTWSEGDDPALKISALEQIVALPHRPTQSQLAGEILADAREEAALAKIVELGGLHTGDTLSRLPFNLVGRYVPPLKVIIGAHWTGGSEGLSYLREVRRATILSFHSAPLGDEIAPILLDLPQVRKIEVYGTKLSKETLDLLEEKLPPGTLDVRSGARLGIGGTENGPAQVRSVLADSAAQKAGLKPGDMITELNGEKVNDFAALTRRIATFHPGDTVELKVTRTVDRAQRLTEQIDIKVTFDQWGTEKDKPPEFAEPKTGQIKVLQPRKIGLDRR